MTCTLQPAPDTMRPRPTSDDIRAAIENLGYDLKLREFAPRTDIGIRNFNERCESLANALSAPMPSPNGVDREPTPSMCIAGGIAWAKVERPNPSTIVDCADACWKAMWDVQHGAKT